MSNNAVARGAHARHWRTILAMSSAFAIASSRPVVTLALRTSVFIGTLLNLINQGDALFGAGDVQLFKLCLTYVVPYCVATYSATSITLKRDQGLNA